MPDQLKSIPSTSPVAFRFLPTMSTCDTTELLTLDTSSSSSSEPLSVLLLESESETFTHRHFLKT